MDDIHVVWDLEDDPRGNVQHILEHGLSIEEVEDVLFNPMSLTSESRGSDNRITFGHTSTGLYIAVAWERVMDDPLTMRPITAYPVERHKRRR